MALPENSPPKSITSSALLRFWASACKRTESFSRCVEIGAHRSILREVRTDAVAIKIEVIDHHLTVFRGILLGVKSG